MVVTVVVVEYHRFRTIIESTTNVFCETNKICFNREVSSTKVKFLRRFPLKLQALVNLLFQCFDKWKQKIKRCLNGERLCNVWKTAMNFVSSYSSYRGTSWPLSQMIKYLQKSSYKKTKTIQASNIIVGQKQLNKV